MTERCGATQIHFPSIQGSLRAAATAAVNERQAGWQLVNKTLSHRRAMNYAPLPLCLVTKRTAASKEQSMRRSRFQNSWQARRALPICWLVPVCLCAGQISSTATKMATTERVVTKARMAALKWWRQFTWRQRRAAQPFAQWPCASVRAES